MTTTYSAEPFPHWVMDDFLPGDQAWGAYEYFYKGTGEWTYRHHLYSREKYTRVQGLHPVVEEVLKALEGPTMRYYFSTLTDLPKLEADPDRFGGGQHLILQGGKLGIHADFTHHPKTGMRRALNLLVYLNANWKKGDGGELELWSADMKRCVKKVEPYFNRAVLFKTSTTSFHGHPDPLDAAERRSLAVYYYLDCYNKQVPPATPYAYVGWNNDYLKTTDYRPRPWEYGLRLRRWLSRHLKG